MIVLIFLRESKLKNILDDGLQEGEGICVTAIREIKLLKELKHANIVKLEAVHLSRKVCKKIAV